MRQMILCSALHCSQKQRSSRVGGGELGGGERAAPAALRSHTLYGRAGECRPGRSGATLQPACSTKCGRAELRARTSEQSGDGGLPRSPASLNRTLHTYKCPSLHHIYTAFDIFKA